MTRFVLCALVCFPCVIGRCEFFAHLVLTTMISTATRRKSRNTTCCAELLACLQEALDLSNAQLQDLLHVQHLVLIKESLLELERKVEPLIQSEQVSLSHDSFAALEADSNRLKGNLLQIQKVRFEAGTVVFVGVRSPVYVPCLSCRKCEQQSDQVRDVHKQCVCIVCTDHSCNYHCTLCNH